MAEGRIEARNTMKLTVIMNSVRADKNREGTQPCPSTENWIKDY